jgi:DNA-binding transcriptional LysR family regulator
MRHFVAVAEELHFGRAAKRLNIAQPPLSQSIRRLEESLGVVLLDRSRRGVALTPAGKIFLREAQRTLVQADLAVKLARREAGRPPEVHLSFIGPLLYRLLPGLIEHYRAQSPSVHLRLFERSSHELMASLTKGEFDVGFALSSVMGTEGSEGCEAFVVERTPLLAAVPRSAPLAAKDAVTLEELAAQPFIMPPVRYLKRMSQLPNLFESRGLIMNLSQEVSQINTAISLVGAGIGCSIVPATAALAHTHNVRFLPIADAVLQPIEMAMIWKPQQISSAAQEFVAYVKDYIARNPGFLDPEQPLVAPRESSTSGRPQRRV